MKPISKTAFYCTGVRALDARTPRPICGDQYAERFMDDEAWRAFEPFRKFRGPNISNAARHRIIDDLLRERLAANPDLPVVIIGAGFDSRAFRLAGGRWLEVDEPHLFAWKEPRLPATGSPNPLTPLPVDFAAERLADRLRPFTNAGPVTIVIEGVLFYLDEPRIRELLRTMRATFPRGEILCDVMTLEFFKRYSRPVHAKIQELGASFVLPERPLEAVFEDEGYTQTAQISTTGRAAELGQMPWYMNLFTRVSPRFRAGYSVRVFAPI